MHTLPDTIPLVNNPPVYRAACCPAQVLVIDRQHGPASVLVDTISKLLDSEVSVTQVDDHEDALRALDCCAFDLVVVGLEEHQSIQLTILPHIHQHYPSMPMMVVGRRLPRLYRQYARHYGARDVVNLPERAADLKSLVDCVADRYLQIM
jgi:DNA-binding NtrC family response regulator